MDSIPKFMASVITIVIGVLLCISLIISGTVVNSARTYHSSVIEQIEASNFDEATIEKCKAAAKSDNYELTVEVISPSDSDPYFFYKVTLGYNLSAPIFGNIHHGELVGYALRGAHINLSNELEPGLYKTGSDYTNLLIPWDELLRDGVVSVTDGIVSSQYSSENGNNPSTDVLAGDLLLPYDGSITEIADHGFRICRSLTGIRVPDSVKRIGREAFDCCDAFARIDLGSGLKSIGTYAFYYDGHIQTVTYNGDINGWCKIDFEGSVSNPLYYHGDLYFKDQLAESIVVPYTVTDLGDTFSGCSSIKSVIIPDNSQLKTINSNAFWWCCDNYDGLTTVHVGEGVEKICHDAFLGCDFLKIIYIPSTVSSFADYSTTAAGLVENTPALDGCNALEYIIIDDENPYYEAVDDKILINKERNTVEFISHSLTTVKIPDGVTTIGTQAAFDRSSLTKVVIPASVTHISRAAFGYCERLTTIEFEGTMAEWNAITFGSVWNKNVPATKVVCSDGNVWF